MHLVLNSSTQIQQLERHYQKVGIGVAIAALAVMAVGFYTMISQGPKNLGGYVFGIVLFTTGAWILPFYARWAINCVENYKKEALEPIERNEHPLARHFWEDILIAVESTATKKAELKQGLQKEMRKLIALTVAITVIALLAVGMGVALMLAHPIETQYLGSFIPGALFVVAGVAFLAYGFFHFKEQGTLLERSYARALKVYTNEIISQALLLQSIKARADNLGTYRESEQEKYLTDLLANNYGQVSASVLQNFVNRSVLQRLLEQGKHEVFLHFLQHAQNPQSICIVMGAEIRQNKELILLVYNKPSYLNRAILDCFSEEEIQGEIATLSDKELRVTQPYSKLLFKAILHHNRKLFETPSYVDFYLRLTEAEQEELLPAISAEYLARELISRNQLGLLFKLMPIERGGAALFLNCRGEEGDAKLLNFLKHERPPYAKALFIAVLRQDRDLFLRAGYADFLDNLTKAEQKELLKAIPVDHLARALIRGHQLELLFKLLPAKRLGILVELWEDIKVPFFNFLRTDRPFSDKEMQIIAHLGGLVKAADIREVEVLKALLIRLLPVGGDLERGLYLIEKWCSLPFAEEIFSPLAEREDVLRHFNGRVEIFRNYPHLFYQTLMTLETERMWVALNGAKNYFTEDLVLSLCNRLHDNYQGKNRVIMSYLLARHSETLFRNRYQLVKEYAFTEAEFHNLFSDSDSRVFYQMLLLDHEQIYKKIATAERSSIEFFCMQLSESSGMPIKAAKRIINVLLSVHSDVIFTRHTKLLTRYGYTETELAELGFNSDERLFYRLLSLNKSALEEAIASITAEEFKNICNKITPADVHHGMILKALLKFYPEPLFIHYPALINSLSSSRELQALVPYEADMVFYRLLQCPDQEAANNLVLSLKASNRFSVKELRYICFQHLSIASSTIQPVTYTAKQDPKRRVVLKALLKAFPLEMCTRAYSLLSQWDFTKEEYREILSSLESAQIREIIAELRGREEGLDNLMRALFFYSFEELIDLDLDDSLVVSFIRELALLVKGNEDFFAKFSKYLDNIFQRKATFKLENMVLGICLPVKKDFGPYPHLAAKLKALS